MVGLAHPVVFVALCTFGAPTQAGAPDERLHVLFLGDRGHHEPEARADQVAPAFARLGIDLWFRDAPAVLDPADGDRLRHVDVILIYANHDEIAPAQEQALLAFVERGGGLVAVHRASYCFRNSEMYVALVGGQFDHHGIPSSRSCSTCSTARSSSSSAARRGRASR